MQDNRNTPLLQRNISEDEVPEDLEEGLDRDPIHDFQHLIDLQPEAVIRCECWVTRDGCCSFDLTLQAAECEYKTIATALSQPVSCRRYLEKQGTKRLGNFKLPVCAILGLIIIHGQCRHENVDRLQDAVAYPLMRRVGMITMGSHDEYIDIQSAWRSHINLLNTANAKADQAKGKLQTPS